MLISDEELAYMKLACEGKLPTTLGRVSDFALRLLADFERRGDEIERLHRLLTDALIRACEATLYGKKNNETGQS